MAAELPVASAVTSGGPPPASRTSPPTHCGAATALAGSSARTRVAASATRMSSRRKAMRCRLSREGRRNASRRPDRDFGPTAGLPTLDPPMARTLRLIVALLVVAALLPAATRTALASQMRYAGGGSGALAIDLDTGATIYSRRPDSARTPASVEKLYTTATALTLYGVEGHLTTRVLGDVGVEPGGVLIGNLYLRGGGDPNFGRPQAAALADRLVFELGLREITGRVVGDESAFDSFRGPPSEGFR